MKLLKRLFREEEGVTLIEYGLLAAIIAVALILTLQDVRDALIGIFEQVVDALSE